jgi:hypothetical protein
VRAFPPLVLVLPLAAGCGGAQLATVTDSEAGTDGGTASDGGTAIDSGTTDGGRPKDGGTPKPFSPVCYNDQGCNADPGISSLTGKCFGGICICAPGFYVQPSGKCAKTPPPDCPTQSGKCFQQPATCPVGSLESSAETNMSCGDLIEAVCCLLEATCAGPAREVAGGGWAPIEMLCCDDVQDSRSAPICVNGWQTCRPGQKPNEKRFGCP